MRKVVAILVVVCVLIVGCVHREYEQWDTAAPPAGEGGMQMAARPTSEDRMQGVDPIQLALLEDAVTLFGAPDILEPRLGGGPGTYNFPVSVPLNARDDVMHKFVEFYNNLARHGPLSVRTEDGLRYMYFIVDLAGSIYDLSSEQDKIAFEAEIGRLSPRVQQDSVSFEGRTYTRLSMLSTASSAGKGGLQRITTSSAGKGGLQRVGRGGEQSASSTRTSPQHSNPNTSNAISRPSASSRTSPQHSNPNSWSETRRHWDLVLQYRAPEFTDAVRYVTGDRLHDLTSRLPRSSGMPTHRIWEPRQQGIPLLVTEGIVYLGNVIRTRDLYSILGNVKADFIVGHFNERESITKIDWHLEDSDSSASVSASAGTLFYDVDFLSIDIGWHVDRARYLANWIYDELADAETNRQTRQNLKTIGLGATTRVPNVPIHFNGSIRIEGTDDEWLTDDEYYDETWSLTGRYQLDGDSVCLFSNSRVDWGGECRVKAYVWAVLDDLGQIRVYVKALFYEGDLGGFPGGIDLEDAFACEFFVHYPPVKHQYGSTVSESINLYNSETGGGDTAKVTVHLSAAMSW